MNAVEMKGIVKRFGALTANDHIDFELRQGEILALLGENGAGKTTLMRILYGLYHADEGSIAVNGKPVEIRSPKDAIAAGIGMVTQHFALVQPLTVAENIILGYTRGFRLEFDKALEDVRSAMTRFGLEIDPQAKVRNLSVGQKQRVEILKALYRNARILILDEPTAVLVPQEIEALFKTLKRLQDDGMSVVFISHKLWEVMTICNRVAVLRDGKAIGTVNVAETNKTELAKLMVGRESFGVVKPAKPCSPNKIVEIRGLTLMGEGKLSILKNISLDVHEGEILGLAGVSGNGQSELANILSGLIAPASGAYEVCGKDLSGATPTDIIAAGVGRIPEDRHSSLVGEMTVSENLAMENLQMYSNHGVMNHGQMRRDAKQLISEFTIKATPADNARTLSGGNLQKVLLARVLDKKPKFILAAQPTRGLDVGATEYVRNKLIEQRDLGAAILLISEDLDEILELSDRIAVIYEGEIVGMMGVQEADAEKLGLLMSGAAKSTKQEELSNAGI